MRKGIEKTYLILHGCMATFPVMQFQICLFCTFSHLSVESLYHKDSNMFHPLNKVKPCSARLVFGWFTKYEYLCCNNFLFFFSPSFSKVILRTAELPFLCNVVSSVCQLFVPHFAMAVFMCILIYLQ